MIAGARGSFRNRSVSPGKKWQPNTDRTYRLRGQGIAPRHLPDGYADCQASCQWGDGRPVSGRGGRERGPLVRAIPTVARNGPNGIPRKPAHAFSGGEAEAPPGTRRQTDAQRTPDGLAVHSLEMLLDDLCGVALQRMRVPGGRGSSPLLMTRPTRITDSGPCLRAVGRRSTPIRCLRQ